MTALRKNAFWLIILSTLTAASASPAEKATVRSLKVADKSAIVIKGTSNIHDWESSVTEINGSGSFTVENGKITGASNVQIVIPVKSIESGKSGMDKKTYEALKADKAPNIQFQLDGVKSVEGNQITATGKLTIAGVTKPVTLTAGYTINGDEIALTGAHTINMNNFNVDPPTAMLGAVKAGEVVTVDYDLVFSN